MSVEAVLSRIPSPEDNWWVEIQTLGAQWLNYDAAATQKVEEFLPAAIAHSRPDQLNVAGQLCRGPEYVYLWDTGLTKEWGPEWELAYQSPRGKLYRRWVPCDSEAESPPNSEQFLGGILVALQGSALSGTESSDFVAGFDFARREGLATGT